MKQVIKTKAYWSEQNAQWESSGLAQKKFCEQQGLVYKQFVYWRGRLNELNIGKKEPKLLKVSTAPEQQQILTESLSFLEVILPTGIKLHIKTKSDISMACSLIKLLGDER
jgi:hypothetical protein